MKVMAYTCEVGKNGNYIRLWYSNLKKKKLIENFGSLLWFYWKLFISFEKWNEKVCRNEIENEKKRWKFGENSH